MHWVTRTITLDVTMLQTAEEKRIGATATGKLSRREFGLLWNKVIETGGVVVGDEIGVTIKLEAARM